MLFVKSTSSDEISKFIIFRRGVRVTHVMTDGVRETVHTAILPQVIYDAHVRDACADRVKCK